MSLRAEIEDLRRDLHELAGQVDMELIRRYAIKRPPPRRLSPYRRARMLAGKLLRQLGFLTEPWLPGLKHVADSEGAHPFVIWALGTDRDTLRAACLGYQKLQAELTNKVPVLITDVADFAFFSRLGWLVEYVPTLSPPAAGYAERKKRYLAWRYRDAPALPLSVGLKDGVRVRELLLD